MSTHFNYLAATILCTSALTLHPQGVSQQPQLPQTEPPPDSGVILHVEVQAVLVPVVVRDAQGHAVGDLSEKDFKVFDQGKQRTISGFSIEQNPSLEATAQPAALQPSAPGGAPSIPTTPAKRFIVFLFDDRHLGPGDILQMKKAGTRMLDQPLADSDHAVVLSFLGVNSGMTRDHAVLQAAVAKLKASDASHSVGGNCPDIDYYTADQIVNKHSQSEWNIEYEKAAKCSHQSSASVAAQPSQQGTDFVSMLVRTAANQALEAGDQDVRETLLYIRDVVHTMSKLPGQRTLIFVSPGFLSRSDEALALQSQILDLAAASNVTFSALDARGLFNFFVPASESGSGSIYGDITGQQVEDHTESMRENEDIMAKLADGTGGTFFHNSNDLVGGLKTLEAGPEYRYLLQISLQDVKLNGSYHALKVEVDRPGAKLQARQGYFAPQPPKKPK